jgi:rhodanese-related sulfurtransferase
VARALKERGFTKVRPLEGGLDAWVEAGHFAEDETIVAILRRGVR